MATSSSLVTASGVVERALVDGLDRRAQLGLRGHQDHGRVAVALAAAFSTSIAPAAGHPDIGEHHVEGPLAEFLEAACALRDS